MLFALNSAITTVANLVLGLFIYFRNPRDLINRYFLGMTFWVALWIVTLYLYYTLTDPLWVLWVGRVNFAAPTLGIYYLFKFVLEFPERLVKIPEWLVRGIDGLGYALAAAAAFTPLIDKNEIVDGAARHMEFGLLYPLWAVFFLGILLWCVLLSAVKLRRVTTSTAKRQMWLILFGFVAAFGIGALTNIILPYLFGVMVLQPLGPVGTLGLTGLIAYAIVKHRLLDVTGLVVRAVSYFLLLVIVVGFEASLIWGLTQILPGEVDAVMVAMGGAVAIVFTFDWLRGLIMRMTERVFFRGRYDTEELLSELTHVMAGTIEIEPLAKKILTRVKEELKLTWVGLMLVKEGEIVKVMTEGGQGGKFYDPRMKELLGGGQDIYTFEEMGEGVVKELFREKELAVVMPLLIKKQVVGLLLMGPRASGDVITVQDRQFLEILAPQAAVAVNNAMSYQEIQEFSKTLEKKVKERTVELRQAQKKEIARAEELLRLKDEFVFIASHDLAAPVTAITGYMDLISTSKAKLNKTTKESLESIGEATRRLKDLVDDLLQVSRGESGTIRVELTEVEAREVVEGVMRLVAQRAKEKGVKLVNELPGSLGKVMADWEKLAEVLENLLTNAVKYNREGGKVVVSGRREGEWVVVEVADTGIGIPKSEQVKVFRKFFRSESDEARRVPGTGLGLFVVKMLVTKMKGKVEFSSEEGQGTSFVVKLKQA